LDRQNWDQLVKYLVAVRSICSILLAVIFGLLLAIVVMFTVPISLRRLFSRNGLAIFSMVFIDVARLFAPFVFFLAVLLDGRNGVLVGIRLVVAPAVLHIFAACHDGQLMPYSVTGRQLLRV
jgi:hypothetical protein